MTVAPEPESQTTLHSVQPRPYTSATAPAEVTVQHLDLTGGNRPVPVDPRPVRPADHTAPTGRDAR